MSDGRVHGSLNVILTVCQPDRETRGDVACEDRRCADALDSPQVPAEGFGNQNEKSNPGTRVPELGDRSATCRGSMPKSPRA